MRINPGSPLSFQGPLSIGMSSVYHAIHVLPLNLAYATKNNRADIVKTNHLSEGLPPMGMWDEMVLHQSMFKQRYAKKPIELMMSERLDRAFLFFLRFLASAAASSSRP